MVSAELFGIKFRASVFNGIMNKKNRRIKNARIERDAGGFYHVVRDEMR